MKTLTNSQIANINGEFIALNSVQSASDLPKCPGVYVLSCTDEVLYVGESSNLRTRWVGHDYSGFVGLIGVSLHYIKCKDHKKIEKDFIKCLRPSFNGKRGSYPSVKREALKTGKSVEEVKQAWHDEMPDDYRVVLRSLKVISQEMKVSAV